MSVAAGDLESRMRELEWFHSMRALPRTWPILRVDSRGFSKLTEPRFEKPFSQRFHDMMVETATALVSELNAIYGYTESDEISVLFHRDTDLFDREIEKLVSVSAGVASSVFSLALGEPAHFDSRMWLGPTDEDVVDYFKWRQADASRCCLNGWCYWSLRKEGLDMAEATKKLAGADSSAKNEFLFLRGTNFNDLPSWQRRGSALYWAHLEKEGHNPLTGETVTTVRRRLHLDEDLPLGDDYGDLLRHVLTVGTRLAGR